MLKRTFSSYNFNTEIDTNTIFTFVQKIQTIELSFGYYVQNVSGHGSEALSKAVLFLSTLLLATRVQC